MFREFLISQILRNRRKGISTVVSFKDLQGFISAKNCGKFEVEIWSICKETECEVVYDQSAGVYTFTPVKYVKEFDYFKTVKG